MKNLNATIYFPINTWGHGDSVAKHIWSSISSCNERLFLLKKNEPDELIGYQFVISYNERKGFTTLESLKYDSEFNQFTHKDEDDNDDEDISDIEINELDSDDFSHLVNKAHERSEGMER